MNKARQRIILILARGKRRDCDARADCSVPNHSHKTRNLPSDLRPRFGVNLSPALAAGGRKFLR